MPSQCAASNLLRWSCTRWCVASVSSHVPLSAAGATARDEFGAKQCGGRIRLLPQEIKWAHQMLSQSSASSLLRWSCAHWLKRVASVLSDVPLSVATLWVESWALIRVLRSAPLRHVSLTWLLSPPLARATNDRPAVMIQPSDSYTCSTIPLEHRLHVSSQLGSGGQWLRQWVGPTAPRVGNMHTLRIRS